VVGEGELGWGIWIPDSLDDDDDECDLLLFQAAGW